MNQKSVQIVSKRNQNGDAQEEGKTQHFGKTDARYWKPRIFRNRYARDGDQREGLDWCIKISHKGIRETINLRTPNQTAAAQKAADIYKLLMGEGWEAVIAKWMPRAANSPNIATLGEFIASAMAVSDARAITLSDYSRSLRRIVADVSGVGRDDPSRYDGHTGGAEKWREKVDAVPLSVLTPEKLASWRLATLRAVGPNPADQRAAKTSINTTLRLAKSLFAPKILRQLAGLNLPANPFLNVEFFERGSMRYDSKIDVPALVEAAREELSTVPENLEKWKAFVLLLFAGLRRNEADKLRWQSVDFMAGVLHIEDGEFFQAKSEDSKGSVQLDAEVVAMLRAWRVLDPKGEYVLRSNVAAKMATTHRCYRAERTFANLITWLRGKGVAVTNALHVLRKEAGTMVNELHGINAASRFLRHGDIAITSKIYVGQKSRVTVNLGSLLSTPATKANVIEFTQQEPVKVPAVKAAKKRGAVGA